MTWAMWLPDLIAAAAAVTGALSWNEGRRRHRGADEHAVLDAAIAAHLAPLEDRVRAIELTRTPDATRAVVREEIAPLITATAALETKVAVFWKTVAVNAATTLHQPDRRRAHVDALLEAFIAGVLTDEQRLELRGYLALILGWEPGSDVGFPVHPGEQVAALILLSTMDLALNEGGLRRAGNNAGAA